MNKARIEALSDGVFAIAMTILVIEVHVPELSGDTGSMHALWQALIHLVPNIAAYAISFTVLAMYWTSHHALYHFFVKSVDRTLAQLNMLYLMLLAFIPFSTALLAEYHENLLAFWVYGANIVAMGAAQYLLFRYGHYSKMIDHHEVHSRTVTQAKIRLLLTPSFALLAMLVAAYSTLLALPLFIIPIVFNLIPGSLDATERFLGITLR